MCSSHDKAHVDDYRYRWTFIRRTTHGIYVFFRILLWEIPKFLVYFLPKEFIKWTGRGIVRIYRAIPPLKEWPEIVKRAIVSFAKGCKDFVLALGKAIKATPKALFRFCKRSGKKIWSGIKAVPGLVKRGVEKTWNGIKAVGIWIGELFMRFHSIQCANAVFSRSFILSSPPLSTFSARLHFKTSLMLFAPFSMRYSFHFRNLSGQR
jgi:hypothetical protein